MRVQMCRLPSDARMNYMANFKARKSRPSRAGCKMRKPHKKSWQTAHKLRDKPQDDSVLPPEWPYC